MPMHERQCTTGTSSVYNLAYTFEHAPMKVCMTIWYLPFLKSRHHYNSHMHYDSHLLNLTIALYTLSLLAGKSNRNPSSI